MGQAMVFESGGYGPSSVLRRQLLFAALRATRGSGSGSHSSGGSLRMLCILITVQYARAGTQVRHMMLVASQTGQVGRSDQSNQVYSASKYRPQSEEVVLVTTVYTSNSQLDDA